MAARYLIEEQIRTAKRHLPKGYSRELPPLLNGASGGLPRVYDIALETISHGDGRVDPESLTSFVAAYQTVNALKLGELWATSRTSCRNRVFCADPVTGAVNITFTTTINAETVQGTALMQIRS